MKKELQEDLYKKYPKIFRRKDLNSDPTKSLMCYGLDVGDGWYSVLDVTCQKLTEACKEYNIGIRAAQVKEKFGALTFYIDIENSHPPVPEKEFRKIKENIYDIIQTGSFLSLGICEDCGDDGKLDNSHVWKKTLCDRCKELRYRV